MDVGYKNANGNFSLRTAALIIRENKLLLAKSEKYDCYYTVGGGIQQNESSDNAVIRECYEETGCRFEIDRLVFVQERFFSLENINLVTAFLKNAVKSIPDGITRIVSHK